MTAAIIVNLIILGLIFKGKSVIKTLVKKWFCLVIEVKQTIEQEQNHKTQSKSE